MTLKEKHKNAEYKEVIASCRNCEYTFAIKISIEGQPVKYEEYLTSVVRHMENTGHKIALHILYSNEIESPIYNKILWLVPDNQTLEKSRVKGRYSRLHSIYGISSRFGVKCGSDMSTFMIPKMDKLVESGLVKMIKSRVIGLEPNCRIYYLTKRGLEIRNETKRPELPLDKPDYSPNCSATDRKILNTISKEKRLWHYKSVAKKMKITPAVASSHLNGMAIESNKNKDPRIGRVISNIPGFYEYVAPGYDSTGIIPDSEYAYMTPLSGTDEIIINMSDGSKKAIKICKITIELGYRFFEFTGIRRRVNGKIINKLNRIFIEKSGHHGIDIENYYRFLKAEGINEFIWPILIEKKIGIKTNTPDVKEISIKLPESSEFKEGSYKYKITDGGYKGTYIRLHELIAHLSTYK